MRNSLEKWIERSRVILGPWASAMGSGMNGMFRLEYPKTGRTIRALASDGGGWEHVSVSIEGAHRCPTWEEMCWVKSLFWGEEEWVIQFHPAESDYVNCHPYTLHLWKPLGVDFPTPPSIFVGPKKRKRHMTGQAES